MCSCRFDHARCGVVWFDARGDFNTPESTITGYLPGMSMAVIAGHCYRTWWVQVGDSTPIRESAILLLGVRDLDLAEKERLDQSAIQVVSGMRASSSRMCAPPSIDCGTRVRRLFGTLTWTP
jgi:arginase